MKKVADRNKSVVCSAEFAQTVRLKRVWSMFMLSATAVLRLLAGADGHSGLMVRQAWPSLRTEHPMDVCRSDSCQLQKMANRQWKHTRRIYRHESR